MRISFLGGDIAGFALIIWWYIRLGMAPLTAVMVVGAFFMIMLVATRIICQGGLAYFTLTAAPTDGMIALFGTKLFAGASGLLAGMSQKVLFVDLRESLHAVSSACPASPSEQRPGPAAFFRPGNDHCRLHDRIYSGHDDPLLPVRHSRAAAGLGQPDHNHGLRKYLPPRMPWNTTTGSWIYIFAFAGALLMLVLVTCYHRLYWWPIHPLGYLTAYSSAMRILWVSFFIGWACNALCMRYGGIVLFKKLQYFFIGLIIGDFLMGGGWAIVGLFTDMSYQVLPD